jgi:hypothetical protein
MQLKGAWTDSAPVPSNILALGLAENLADDPIAQVALRASTHFNYDAQATYIILTPPTTIATGQPVYCGYHTQTSSVDGLGNPYRLQYSFIPFLNLNWPELDAKGYCESAVAQETRNPDWMSSRYLPTLLKGHSSEQVRSLTCL